MRCITPSDANELEPPVTNMLTLSGAKAIAKAKGYQTLERDGRLYLIRGGVEVGSTLISTYQPEGGEEEVSRNAFDRITSEGEP